MNELVVKDNALMNASYSVNLAEQRLILLAIIEVRRTNSGISANDPLTIYAEDYIKQFNVHRTTAYQALKDACKAIFNRYFSYEELFKGKKKTVRSRWVSQIGYIDELALVELIFAPAVVPLITQLESRFSQYAIEQVSQLSSVYAVRLYELLITWRTKCSVPETDLMSLRGILGVADGEYVDMHNFKKRVLDIAVNQINKYTDIVVDYKQHKRGRFIAGFSFNFKFKEAEKYNSALGTNEKIYSLPLEAKSTKQEPTNSIVNEHVDENAKKTEVLRRYAHAVATSKLANQPLEMTVSIKEIEEFRQHGLMN